MLEIVRGTANVENFTKVIKIKWLFHAYKHKHNELLSITLVVGTQEFFAFL